MQRSHITHKHSQTNTYTHNHTHTYTHIHKHKHTNTHAHTHIITHNPHPLFALELSQHARQEKDCCHESCVGPSWHVRATHAAQCPLQHTHIHIHIHTHKHIHIHTHKTNKYDLGRECAGMYPAMKHTGVMS